MFFITFSEGVGLCDLSFVQGLPFDALLWVVATIYTLPTSPPPAMYSAVLLNVSLGFSTNSPCRVSYLLTT